MFTMARFSLILSLSTVLTRGFAPAGKSQQSTLQLALSSWDDDAEVSKKRLLQLGASYDRGFGATATARDQVEATVRSLELLNLATDAARGISTGVESPFDRKLAHDLDISTRCLDLGSIASHDGGGYLSSIRTSDCDKYY
jgi:hypothetical protein